MQQLSRLFLAVLLLCATTLTATAQEPDTTKQPLDTSRQALDTTGPTSVDPDMLGMQEQRQQKEYTIDSVAVTGLNYLDKDIVLSISGLQKGDKLTIPGSDAFAKAINNLWRQKFFSDVQIYITTLTDDHISLEISVKEMPKLASYKFIGVKKTEKEELEKKMGLSKSTIITENTRRNAVEAIKKFYTDKGFKNIQVTIEEKKDSSIVNSNDLTFIVDKGRKVRINQ